MIKARQLVLVVVSFVFASLLSGTSHAALIAEIGINIPATYDPNPPASGSLRYGFSANSNSPIRVGGEWLRQITAGDVGMTFEAPPGIVEPIASALARSNAGIGIYMDEWAYTKALDDLQSVGWEIPGDRAIFHKYVPDITKFPVNRLTMTIDSFIFERFGLNDANTGGGHTIRIYGVPEPPTFSFAVCCAGLLIAHRRRKLNCLPAGFHLSKFGFRYHPMSMAN
jgi:hypothetical protein